MNCIGQLFSKKDRKNSTLSNKTRNSFSSKNNSKKSSSSHIDSNVSSALSSSKQSKEGHNFKYESGRRYHGDEDVAYILPNDDDEADRVHQQHWILRYILQCNYHTPVTKMLQQGILVLDSGCGPATWSFEMGETYPNSKFYGIDISCVFPENIKPANVEFIIGNIAKHIPYPDNTFDYIHQRLLFLGLTEDDWESTLKELYRVLKPGGYIELAEFDMQNLVNIGPCLSKLQDITADMFVARGLPKKVCGQMENRLIKAGFEQQVLKISPLPINHSGKAGRLFWDDFKHAYTNVRPILAKVNTEWEDDQVFANYIDGCGAEANENKADVNWYVCYAQKPLV